MVVRQDLAVKFWKFYTGEISQPQITSFLLTTTMPLSTKERKLFSQQVYVLSTVENNPILLDLLEIATSSAQKTVFIESLLDDLSISSHFSQLDKTPFELFDVFTAWAGTHSNTRFSGVDSALQYRKIFFLDERAQKRQFISEIGLGGLQMLSHHIFPRLVLSVCC